MIKEQQQQQQQKKKQTQNETKHERKQKNRVNRSGFNYALHKQLRIAKIIYTLQALIKYWARSAY